MLTVGGLAKGEGEEGEGGAIRKRVRRERWKRDESSSGIIVVGGIMRVESEVKSVWIMIKTRKEKWKW